VGGTRHPHAHARGVTAAYIARWLWDNFLHAHGAACEVLGKPAEVIEEVVGGGLEVQAVPGIHVLQCFLECAKQAPAARQG